MAEEKSKTTLLKEKIMMTEPKGVKRKKLKRQTAFAMVTKSFLITHPLSVRLFAILLNLPKKQVLQSMNRTKNIRQATGFIM